MAGYDAKNGRTKSEFRDICQNKLLQLSLSIIHHFSVYFLCFSQQEKLMVSLLNFCCVQYQLSKHSVFFFFFLNNPFKKKKFILLSEGFNIYKCEGAICIHLNAISWCEHSQLSQLEQEHTEQETAVTPGLNTPWWGLSFQVLCMLSPLATPTQAKSSWNMMLIITGPGHSLVRGWVGWGQHVKIAHLLQILSLILTSE